MNKDIQTERSDSLPLEPSIGGSFKNAGFIIRKNFGQVLKVLFIVLSTFLIFFIIPKVIAFAFPFISKLIIGFVPAILLVGILIIGMIATICYTILVGLLIGSSPIYLFLRLARGDSVKFRDIFRAIKYYDHVILAFLYTTIPIAIVNSSIYLILHLALGNTVKIWDIFRLTRYYDQVIQAPLFTTILISAGSLLLSILGIYVSCRLSFIFYLVIDRGMRATEAMQETWRLTKEYWKQIIVIYLPSFICSLPFYFFSSNTASPVWIFFFIIIMLPISVWVLLSHASFYHAIHMKKGKKMYEFTPVR